jgi:competence protein ComEC
LARAGEGLAELPVEPFLLLPICVALGIGVWFGQALEPGVWAYGAAGGILALGLGMMRHPLALMPGLGMAAGAAGYLACGLRILIVAAPMLSQPYYGPVTGRIIEIDRSSSDALRLTLDRVVLLDHGPETLPEKVRISLRGADQVFEPGSVVMVTARIAAPEGAVEPGGFDFRRMAWFQGLGALGYTANPVVVWAEPGPWDSWINRIRARLSHAITASVPGDAGAFASGAMTGDRSGITAAVVQDLRDSSLAHLLAISGMNMAFIVSFVFGLIRTGLVLVPALALRVEAKKIAAVVAFGVAWFYLALAGANVATTRAFLMVSIMLGAVLLDRRAITLRSVALAALALMLPSTGRLCTRSAPETLLEPGFQLSFSATVALIAGFGPIEGAMRRRHWAWPARALGLLVATSVLAGAATTPYAAATFNRTAPWGLIANLMTVPVMSLVMGAGAMALILWPLGLSGIAFWAMGKASAWILFVAHWVAGWEGAVRMVPQPGPWVIPLLTLGAIFLVIWQGRGRLWFLLPIGLAFGLWTLAERPVLLIAADGGLVGVLGPEGRALSKARGGGFAATSWLESDGDGATPKSAALRAGITGKPSGDRSFAIGAGRGVILAGKGAGARVAEWCAKVDLVILPERFGPMQAEGGCRLIEAGLLQQSGALAGRLVPGGMILTPVGGEARIWSGRATPAPEIFVPFRGE